VIKLGSVKKQVIEEMIANDSGFPQIKRVELSPFIQTKKNCMDCCNPETVDVREERRTRAEWARALAKHITAILENRLAPSKDENSLFFKIWKVRDELLRQAEVDAK
jgi:hypothetical protein